MGRAFFRAMRIATWNVNSAKVRAERIEAWLGQYQPDALCLQELKTTAEAFPHDVVEGAGYQAEIYGQKTYNGVAILSPHPIESPGRGLGDDEAARLVWGTIQGVTVLSAYFPNGKRVGSDSYQYKLNWMGELLTLLETQFDPSRPLVLAGDFNVAPDSLDAANPDKWAESVLCHQDARDALERIRDWGFVDVFRKHNPEGHVYSWWDYRMLGFPKNDGLRIDHIFATAPLAAHSTGAFVDREQRKGTKLDKPSDHAPVVVDFEWPEGV